MYSGNISNWGLIDKAGEWLDFCGLSDLSGVAANKLPFGKGRLL